MLLVGSLLGRCIPVGIVVWYCPCSCDLASIASFQIKQRTPLPFPATVDWWFLICTPVNQQGIDFGNSFSPLFLLVHHLLYCRVIGKYLISRSPLHTQSPPSKMSLARHFARQNYGPIWIFAIERKTKFELASKAFISHFWLSLSLSFIVIFGIGLTIIDLYHDYAVSLYWKRCHSYRSGQFVLTIPLPFPIPAFSPSPCGNDFFVSMLRSRFELEIIQKRRLNLFTSGLGMSSLVSYASTGCGTNQSSRHLLVLVYAFYRSWYLY